jgi:hypothetical protein
VADLDQNKIREIIEEVLADSVSLETKELIYLLVSQSK